jgi:hypothetical protein
MNSPQSPQTLDLDELVRLVGEALPDSLSRRRRVLRGLVARLPMNYHFRDDIAALLVTLELHELSRNELPLALPVARRANKQNSTSYQTKHSNS